METITIKCPDCDSTEGRKNNRGELRCNACWAIAEEAEAKAPAVKNYEAPAKKPAAKAKDTK